MFPAFGRSFDRIEVFMAEQQKKESTRERRAWVHISTSHEVSCRPTPSLSGTASLGILRDISPGGMGLLLSRFFAPGSLLIVELSDEAKRRPHCFPVQVVHSAPEGKRHWSMGCAFIYPPSNEELQVFA
jgi:hypothetical protein